MAFLNFFMLDRIATTTEKGAMGDDKYKTSTSKTNADGFATTSLDQLEHLFRGRCQANNVSVPNSSSSWHAAISFHSATLVGTIKSALFRASVMQRNPAF